MIFNFEKKVLDFIEKNILIVVAAFVTFLGIIVRLSLKDGINGDITTYLIPWYENIKENGGIGKPVFDIAGRVCNYTFPYQFLIYIMTRIPINPIYLYKALSCIFDIFNGAAVAHVIFLLFKDGQENFKARNLSVLGFIIVMIHPIIIANSALWGQCDSIYTFWILMALIEAINEKYIRMFVFYGIAFSFKIQAIFILPFFLFLYFRKRKFSIMYLFIVPLTVILMNIPAFIQGRTIGEAFGIYVDNVGLYSRLALNYPSFWLIFCGDLKDEEYFLVKNFAIIIMVAMLALHMFIWIINKVELSAENIINCAFIIVYTAVIFLPGMHERYGYVYEMLAIIILVNNVTTIIPYLIMVYITLNTYGGFLFHVEENIFWLSFVNCLVYMSYCILNNKKICMGQKD